MKNILTAICATILFSSCGLFKKIEKSEKSDKKTEITRESTRDSTLVVNRTTPSESTITFDIKTLGEMIGDFEQRISSGNGTESVISKKNGQLTVQNKNSGSVDTTSKVKEKEKETIYTSEFVIKETKKIISRLPWWFWLGLIIWLLIVFRKVIAQIFVLFFPSLGSRRVLKIFLGSK